MDMYSEFMDKSKSNKNNKHNFVFIHFPETTAKFGKSSSGKQWEDYTKDISLLFSGHFHDIVGKLMIFENKIFIFIMIYFICLSIYLYKYIRYNIYSYTFFF